MAHAFQNFYKINPAHQKQFRSSQLVFDLLATVYCEKSLKKQNKISELLYLYTFKILCNCSIIVVESRVSISYFCLFSCQIVLCKM